MHNAFLPGSFSTQICYFIFYRDISFTSSRNSYLLIVPWWPFADPLESTLLLTASKPQLWTGNHVVVLAMLDPISSDEKKKKKGFIPWSMASHCVAFAFFCLQLTLIFGRTFTLICKRPCRCNTDVSSVSVMPGIASSWLLAEMLLYL